LKSGYHASTGTVAGQANQLVEDLIWYRSLKTIDSPVNLFFMADANNPIITRKFPGKQIVFSAIEKLPKNKNCFIRIKRDNK
jgi:hypothetical protein